MKLTLASLKIIKLECRDAQEHHLEILALTHMQ